MICPLPMIVGVPRCWYARPKQPYARLLHLSISPGIIESRVNNRLKLFSKRLIGRG
jgi:hypothetical protein